MFNIGGGELLVIALIALIVLGPSRLPEAARTAGKVMGEIRRLSTGFQREIRDALEDSDAARTRRERAPLAAAVDDADAAATDAAAEAATATDAGTRRDDGDGTTPPDGADPARPVEPADPGGLAPEVGEALDQVVGAAPARTDAAPETETEPAPDPADRPEPGSGDARAAS